MRIDARRLPLGLMGLAGLILLASAGTSARLFPDLIPPPANFRAGRHRRRERHDVLCGVTRCILACADSGGRLADP